MTPTSLSVVTVVRNNRRGLERTLASVRRQTLPGIEHIVVDGSDRPDQAFLDLLSSEGVKVLTGRTNGPYSAMNSGAELAEGTALSFLNAGDEYATPAAAEILTRLLDRSSWGYGSMLVISAGGHQRLSEFRPFHRWQLTCGLRYVPHPASVVETELFREAKGFDASYDVAADQNLFLRISRDHEPTVTTEVIASFATGGMSTRSVASSARDFERMRRELDGPIAGSSVADRAVTFASAFVRQVGRWVRQGREASGVG